MAGFQLVEPDDEVYADLSARFGAYNAAFSTWDPRSFCLTERR